MKPSGSVPLYGWPGGCTVQLGVTRQKVSQRCRHVSPTRPRSSTTCSTPAALSSWLGASPACPAPTTMTSRCSIALPPKTRRRRSEPPTTREYPRGCVAIHGRQRRGRVLGRRVTKTRSAAQSEDASEPRPWRFGMTKRPPRRTVEFAPDLPTEPARKTREPGLRNRAPTRDYWLSEAERRHSNPRYRLCGTSAAEAR